MARFADRIAYRFAGLVWTAIYSGLNSRTNTHSFVPVAAAEKSASSSVQTPIAA